MTIARAVIRPGKWTGRKATWPRVDLTYVEPITGAYYDWAADQLPLGSLTQWASLNNGVPMIADDGVPEVVNSGGTKAVQLDGLTDRMRVLTPGVPAQHTVISVFRLIDPQPGDAITFGYNNPQGGAVLVATDESRSYYGFINPNYLMPEPRITADTNWHISMLVSNGANSAFRLDDQERVGSVTSEVRQGLTLGWSNNTAKGNRTKIEYRRNIILPPLNPTERAALYSKLKIAYGI